MNINKSFLLGSDRWKLWEKARLVLESNPVEVPTDVEAFVKDTASVVIRLLETVNHFEKANFKLSRVNTDLDLYLQEREEASDNLVTELLDRINELNVKNTALQEYATKMEGEAKRNGDLARDAFLDAVSKTTFPELEFDDEDSTPHILDDVFARLDEVSARVEKLEGRSDLILRSYDLYDDRLDEIDKKLAPKKKAVKNITVPKKVSHKKK